MSVIQLVRGYIRYICILTRVYQGISDIRYIRYNEGISDIFVTRLISSLKLFYLFGTLLKIIAQTAWESSNYICPVDPRIVSFLLEETSNEKKKKL